MAHRRKQRVPKPLTGNRSLSLYNRRLLVERLERRDMLSISLGAQFGGMNENYTSWYPLQITAAEGPNYVVDVAGGEVAIYSQSGQFIENKPITNFTGGSGDNPTVVYDPTVAGGGRYIICSGVSTVYFGISNTSDPTQGWHSYTLSFPSSVDGGRFGFNASAYFVWYSDGGNPNTIVIQKSSILSPGGTMVSYTQNSPGHPTLQVDDTTTNNPSDPAWFYSSTQLIEETNYLSASPTYTTYNISGGTFATSKYAEIRTINGVETMAGVDDEASLNWSTNSVNALYWSEVNVATATVIQSGSIANPSGWSDMGYAYSSLAPNGDIGITFLDATASDTEMGMFITGRRVSDSAGTMNTPIAVFTGSYDGTRVGDYGSVNADINNDTFWATEYTDSHPGYTGIVDFGLTNTAPAVMQPVMGLGAAPSDGTQVNLQWNAVPGATSYMVERSSDGVTFVAPTPPTYDSLTAPTGLTAALAASGTGIALSWNGVSGAAGYLIQRAASNSSWTQIATTAAGTLVYSDSGPTGGQLYYYRVSATDSSAGQSAPSTVATIVNRPSAPSTSVNGGWAYQLQVAWNLIPSATSYTVLRSTDGVNYSTIGTTPADDVTYTDFTVNPDSKYWYEVIANNPVGSSTGSTALGISSLPVPTGLTITQGAGQLALQWTAVSGATNYEVQRSTDDINFSTIAVTATNTYTDTGAAPLTTYYYRITAVDAGTGVSSASPSAVVYSTAATVAPLPYQWQAEDIGVSNVGATGFSAGVYTVVSYGADIWGTSDQFHFTYLSVTGNATIIARVTAQTNTGSWAKAGVMIRNSLAAGDQYALECITPGNGSAFQYRTTSGGSANGTSGDSGPVVPYWVKLVRSGDTITGYRSPDGSTWTQDGSVSITMGSTVYIGLEADGNSTSAVTNTATFSNVSVSSSALAAPTVGTAAAASPGTVTGTTTGLSVLGADAIGESNLYYFWSATSLPSGAAQPTFSPNGTNASKNTTATFSHAGSYTLEATIVNTYGLTVTSSVNVTVSQTASGITIVPATAIVSVSATEPFTAYGADQFGQPMGGLISPTWSVSPSSGAGTISSSGLYTAPSTQSTATITATSGGYTATAGVQAFNRDIFTNPVGGSWATTTNWQNSTIASGAGVAADFSTLALSSAPTVTLDGARTVGDLLFGDTNNSYRWTLNTGSGGPLTLSTTSGTPTIAVANQTTTIGAVLAGTAGLTKTGAGAATVSGAGTWTGTTTVAAGMLEVDAKSGDVPYVVSPGATLRIGYSTSGGYANTELQINGSGATSSAGFYLAGGKTYNASGQIQLLTAPTTIRQYGTGTASIGTFDINGNGLWSSAAASGSAIASNVQMVSSGYGMSITVDPGANTAAGDLTINGPLNVGNLGFYKRGSGSILLNGYASPSNVAVNLQAGTVICGVNDSIGVNASLPISSGATLVLNGTSQYVANLSGAGTVVGSAAITSSLTVTESSANTFSGTIGGTGTNQNNLAFTKWGSAALTLSHHSTYTGDTTIVAGTLQQGIASALPYGSGDGNLVLNGGASAGIFDVNGYSASIDCLSGAVGTVLGQVANNAAGTNATLTLGNNNATATYAGVIENNTGSGGTLALSKIGSGTQTLSGSNTYTGGTIVSAGALVAANPSAIAAGTSLTIGAGATLIFGPSSVGTSRVAPSLVSLAPTTAVSASAGDTRVQTSTIVVASPVSVPFPLPAVRDSVLGGVVGTSSADRFVSPSLAQGIVAYPGWLGQTASTLDTMDQQRRKDAAIMALDTVFAQYGQRAPQPFHGGNAGQHRVGRLYCRLSGPTCPWYSLGNSILSIVFSLCFDSS
jgi:autotransporter-associated beta strand protein